MVEVMAGDQTSQNPQKGAKQAKPCSLSSQASSLSIEVVDNEKQCCWVVTRIFSFVSYIFQRCFCFGSSRAKVSPEHNPEGEVLSHSDASRTSILITSLSIVNAEDARPQRKPRPGTPRHFTTKIEYHPPEPPADPICTQNQGDMALEVEVLDDSPSGIIYEIKGTPSKADWNCKPSGDDSVGILQKSLIGTAKPISLVIGPKATPPESVRLFLNPDVHLQVLLVQFNMHLGGFTTEFTPDSVFEIVETVLDHPYVEELRILIGNETNHKRNKQNILPESGIGGTIRKDYPMKLNTLVIYCPGVTLRHLYIFQGFLLSQDQLEILICNFDSVDWHFYVPILENLGASLRQLTLSSLTNHNGSISELVPFDWLVLSTLSQLRNLTLSGDSFYYGLCHKNFEAWNMETLVELTLRYVDLAIKDVQHILRSVRLRRIKLQYFTPIPIPISPSTSLPANEFNKAVRLALQNQHLISLYFSDIKLPGTMEDREKQFRNCANWRYTMELTMGEGKFETPDIMSFVHNLSSS